MADVTEASMGQEMPVLDLGAPGSSLGAYIRIVNSFSILSPEKEKLLADAFFYEKNFKAAHQLVLSHLRLVVHISSTYDNYGLSRSDLIQEGNVGLMKAVKNFNPEKGVRLASYAVHWIKAEIQEFILRNWKIVKVATTKSQRKLFFNLRKAKRKLAWLNMEEISTIAKDLEVDVEEVLNMEKRLSENDVSFEGRIYDEDFKESRAPINYLLDENSDQSITIEQDDWYNNNAKNLEEAMANLDSRNRDIIERRWLNEKKETLQDLANKYNISVERVRQLEKHAIGKLRIEIDSR